MSACLTENELAEWAEGRGRGDVAAAMYEHIDRCPECLRVLAMMIRLAAPGDPADLLVPVTVPRKAT